MRTLLLACGFLALPLLASANCVVETGNLEATPDGRFNRMEPVAGEAVVEDLTTGLLWQGCEAGVSGGACDSGAALTFDWSGALQHADAAMHGGFDDWRLPSARELATIIETACSSPTLNTTAFPVDIGASVWTGSGVAQGNQSAYLNAWVVSFSTGERLAAAKSSNHRVRLVRAGSGLAEFDAGADYTPDPVGFQSQTGRPVAQNTEFGPITVSGTTTPIGIAVLGDGVPAYSINGGSFTALPGVVRNGDVVRLRHLSAMTAGQAVDSQLLVGPLQLDARSVTASNNAALAALSLDQSVLAPMFSAGTLDYAAGVANAMTGVRVTATLDDPMASLQIAGVATDSGQPSAPVPLAPGVNVIDVDVLAEDGLASRRYTITVQRALFASTTTLQSDTASALPGSTVVFTATVIGDSPTGQVRFLANSVEIPGCGARSLSTGSTRTASCSTNSLNAGETLVRAEYSGDAANLVSSAERIQTVNTPPVIGIASPVSFDEDASLSVPVTVSDAESAGGQLQLTVVETMPAGLLDAVALMDGLAGSGADRSLNLVGLADAFGSGQILLRVEDPQGGRSESTLQFEVLPVNDPPSALVPPRLVHPAGASGPQTIQDFATSLSVGPANESAQMLGFEVLEVVDPDAVLSGFAVDAAGHASYLLSGRDGLARLRLTPVDDGGVLRGGLDRGAAQWVRVFVGPGSDVQTRIERRQPADQDLSSAIIAGAENGEFGITARNHGPQAVASLAIAASALQGLEDLIWECVPGGLCSPESGFGRVVLNTPIEVDQEILVILTARFRPADSHLVLDAVASAAPGALVGRDDDRQVLVEALHPTAIFYSGFE